MLLAKWMFYFIKAMNQKKMIEAIAVLSDLSKFSLQFYRELALRQANAIGFEQKGLLMVSKTDEGMRAAEAETERAMERLDP